MNKSIIRLVAGAALVVGSIAAAGGASPDDHGSGGYGSIEGTWVAVVPSGSAQATPFLSMQTHTSTGQALEDNNTPQVRSTAQGEWVRTGRRQFQRTLTFFNFQPLAATQGVRVYAGVTRVSSDITLDRDGDSYVAVSRFDVYNAGGALITSGQNTAQARRCGLGSSVQACLGLSP